MGNGRMGILVWGESTLRLTIARAGFWFHPRASENRLTATYEKVREAVESRNAERLREMFPAPDGQRPLQLGGGRLEIFFEDGWHPVRTQVVPPSGFIEIWLGRKGGEERCLCLSQSRSDEFAWIEGLEGDEQILLRPAWDFLQPELTALGLVAPEQWSEPKSGGFFQSMPEDNGLALGWAWSDQRLVLGTCLGAVRRWRPPADNVIEAAACEASVWWQEYWSAVPALHLPDAELQSAYDSGLYRQAGLTPPEGLAATLQGPWMEDDRIPPWSNDYHFNINVQLIYGPALATNRASHLEPLWEMLRGWMPTLQSTGEHFFGRPGALLLPHAVDDRCGVVGAFWTGTIDHACTAWMGLLAWQHYRYTNEKKVLRDLALPLLLGAFEGYWAMLENSGIEEFCLSLPLSVSPEYGGSSLDACGKNASFQLAACHAVVRALVLASKEGEIGPDARWQEVARCLPPYSTVGSPSRIAIWEGQDLAESHRHHSHLAGIWPFMTLDPEGEEHWKVIGHSIGHWAEMGAGKWTGWCVPWAAILCSRCGLPDAAVAWLRWGLLLFTNESGAPLHDADFAGAGGLGAREILSRRGFLPRDAKHEIMQLDAAMATVSAIIELLVRCREGEIVVLDRLPHRWRDFSFRNILAEGGFLITAEVKDGDPQLVQVLSQRGGPLRIRLGLPSGSTITSRQGSSLLKNQRIEIETDPGETVLFERPERKL